MGSVQFREGGLGTWGDEISVTEEDGEPSPAAVFDMFFCSRDLGILLNNYHSSKQTQASVILPYVGSVMSLVFPINPCDL